jgi:hypothetical protein
MHQSKSQPLKNAENPRCRKNNNKKVEIKDVQEKYVRNANK